MRIPALFAVLFLPLYGVDETAILKAIAIREASPEGAIGKRHELGIYQMMPATVLDAGGYDRLSAGRHLHWLQRNLEKAGHNVSPFNIALCWNAGLTRATSGKAKDISYIYALEVTNIYDEIMTVRRSLAAVPTKPSFEPTRLGLRVVSIRVPLSAWVP